MKLLWLGVGIFLITLSWAINTNAITVSYHKRENNSTIIFVSIHYSNIVIEISDKKTKSSLEWIDK